MSELAIHIARRIFECPAAAGDDKVQRIAMRGGTPHKETDLGGLCEGALVDVVRKALASYKPQSTSKGVT